MYLIRLLIAMQECSNLAREGLRTLVYARRVLSPGVWQVFQARYTKAKESMDDREGAVRAAIAGAFQV